mmetsp:Transcript_33034/g.78904  ORF Transcript_33034/g.78904 Transcript_33034/m.78904 type:complete len:873 (+) Transcript_33034:340-2958(+)
MEDLLMNDADDSDSDESSKNKLSDATAKPAAAAQTPSAAQHAPNLAKPESKSELTNRLKNLYKSTPSKPPKMATALPAQSKQMNAPAANTQPVAVSVPTLAPPKPQQQLVSSPTTMAPPRTTNPAASQQAQIGRMPAALPKARTSTAPPPNRSGVATVPTSTASRHHSTIQKNIPGSSRAYPPNPMAASQQQMAPPPQRPPSSHHRATSSQHPMASHVSQVSRSAQQQQVMSRTAAPSSSHQVSVSEKEKKEKEKFLMFTRVLMKYLEQRDQEMHTRAKAQIKECYEKNKQGDPNFKSLTTSMKARLKQTVGDVYWKKAHDYLDHFLKQKKGGQARQHSAQHSTSQQSRTPPDARLQQQTLSKRTYPGQNSSHYQQQQQREMERKQAQEMQKREEQEQLRLKQQQRQQQAASRAAAMSHQGNMAKVVQAGTGQVISSGSRGGGITMDSAAGTGSAARPPAAIQKTTTTKAKEKKSESKKTTGTKRKKPPAKSTSSSSATSTASKRRTSQQGSKFGLLDVDHAVLLDVKSVPNITKSMDVKLADEQRILLYGDDKDQSERVKNIAKVANKRVMTSQFKTNQFKQVGMSVSLPYDLPPELRGWGDHNVLTVRNAWAAVRLPEAHLARVEKKKQEQSDKAAAAAQSKSSGKAPSPAADGDKSSTSTSSRNSKSEYYQSLKDDDKNHVWYNEVRAQSDPTLAILSAATEMYLKTTIEQAIGKARLRQNLDGIRLLHKLSKSGKNPPPAVIRLGCDVRRQVALAEGNACKTYQRMEEAISRQESARADKDLDEMLLEATSMADLSKKVPLKSAAQRAELEAKRKFQVFAGSESHDPFGVLPKKSKVILQDIVVSESQHHAAMAAVKRKRFRVGLGFM